MAAGSKPWALLDSNQRPTDYESAALTAELRARTSHFRSATHHNQEPAAHALSQQRIARRATPRIVRPRLASQASSVISRSSISKVRSLPARGWFASRVIEFSVTSVTNTEVL